MKGENMISKIAILCLVSSVGFAVGVSDAVKDLQAARLAIDAKKAAQKQKVAIDRASEVQCSSLASEIAKGPPSNDKAGQEAYENYVDELLRLTFVLNEAVDDGSAIENCFFKYYQNHREKMDERLVKLPKDARDSIREGLSDYEDSLKSPDERHPDAPH